MWEDKIDLKSPLSAVNSDINFLPADLGDNIDLKSQLNAVNSDFNF
jgi:hypothetical protein